MASLAALTFVLVLQMAFLQGNEASPIAAREVDVCTGDKSINLDDCTSTIDELVGADQGSRTFNFDVSLKHSLNDDMVYVSLIDRIQDLDKEENENGCGYRLAPSKSATNDYPYCYWEYNCTHNPRRIPQHLCRAECRESCFTCPMGYSCQPINYKVPVLELVDQDNCNPYNNPDREFLWEWKQEIVPVACACKKNATDFPTS